MGRAVHVHHGGGADLDSHRVDHQRVAFVMADGIAMPRGNHLFGVRAVHPYTAELMILHVQDGHHMRLLDHLHFVDPEDIGRGHGRALVRGIGKGHSGLRYLAVLFHDLRRAGLENRAGVIAHQHLCHSRHLGPSDRTSLSRDRNRLHHNDRSATLITRRRKQESTRQW